MDVSIARISQNENVEVSTRGVRQSYFDATAKLPN